MNRLNGDGACSVGLHVDAILIRQRWQVGIVDHDLGPGVLGQLGQHVVVLVQIKLDIYS